MWQPTKACTLLCLSWFWLPVALAGVVGAAESATSLAPVSEVEGASECPCLTAISENKNGYNTVVDRLRSEGVNESKGTNGCQVYNADECNTYPLSCKQKWCYVDIEACKVNQRLCKEARGRRGSRASPHCRERPRYESKYVNDSSVLFSYETCGALGSYNETRFEKWMANLEVQAAVDPRKIYPNEMLQELVIKAFAKYSFLKSAARANASQMDVSIPILNVADQSYWKTPASTGSSCSQDEAGRFVCNSGYSNCVYDVAVGKLDLCIADMWITPGRSAIAQFLPPVRFDMFYLVQAAKPRTTEPTVGAIMERPFKPFTRWAWGAIGIFMLVSALCFLARRHLEEQSNQQVNETPPAARPGGSTSSLASRGHDLLDLIGGARSFASSNRALCKLVGFGFAWAMLVLTTTYTANLTDILAWERKQVTSLQRLKDAKNMSICVDQEAWSHFNLMYHELENVTWTPVKSSGDIPQLLHDDNCSAAVMYQEAIDSMHAGKFAGAGRPLDYDCKIRKVPSEEVLLTFAVGFPVVPPLVHGLSWALTSVLEEGTAAKAEIQHRTSLRGSFVTNCRVEEESEKGLDWSDVLGALIDAFIIITLGALIFVLRGQCCKRVSEPHTRSPRHPTSSAQPPFPIE